MASKVRDPRISELMTAEEAAKMLKVSKSAIHHRITYIKSIQVWKRKGIVLLLKKDVLALKGKIKS